MALENVCKQIFDKYAALGNIVNRTKNDVLGQINGLEEAITDLVPIPQIDLDDMLEDLGDINVEIPITIGSAEKEALKCLTSMLAPGFDLSKIDDALDWLDLPTNFLQKYLDSVKDGFDDVMKSILDLNPLGQAGDLLGLLDKGIKSTGLDGILNQLDALLACLNAGCSALYPGTPDYAGDIRSTLGLSSSNSFDTSIFSTWNSDPDVISQLSQVTTSVRNLNNSITNLTLPGL